MMKNCYKMCLAIIAVSVIIGIGFVVLNRYRVSLAADIIFGRDIAEFRPHMRGFLARHWQQAPDKSIVLIGDSHLQSLYIAHSNVVNLSIGGETVADVTERLQDYPDLSRAGYILLCIGSNDALRLKTKDQFSADITTLLNTLPNSVPLRIAAIPPLARGMKNFDTRMRKIRDFNRTLMINCRSSRCTFVGFPDSLVMADGSLVDTAHGGDHLHLSATASQQWLQSLLASLR
jgi:lysophospholipase L1-like esterase